MNYCAIAYTFYENDYRVRRYAEALVEPDNKVDVIALKAKDKPNHGVLNGVNIYRIQERSYDERGPLAYLFKLIRFFIRGSIILLFRHIRYRYKIIHIHNVPDFLVFMGFIPKLLGARIILDIHDVLPEFYCEKFDKSPDALFAKGLLLIEKMSARFSNHVIVANDLWREKIITRNRLVSHECTTLLNYPDLRLFNQPSHKPNKNHLNIVYPGTISHHHGLDIAVKAIAIVKKELPIVRLDLYSRPSNYRYYNWLISVIDDLGLRRNIKLFNPVSNERLGKVIAHADIGIVPKRAGIFSSEAFSTKILEFMAAGLPVIASRTKIDEYYFDDSMIMFFQPENPEDLARCIIHLYHNPQKAKSLANKAREFVAENNWEAKKHIYLELVDSLLKKH